jgi:lysophospholipase L1-like esterase
VLPSAHPRIDAQAVAQANALARAACATRPRCTFVEAPPWRTEYLLPDGVHLSATGYAAWAAALRD